MTNKRSIALIYFSCLLFGVLSGQHMDPALDSTSLTAEQLHQIELMAADTVDSELDVPNVFSPNGDGNNDYFEVTTNGTTVYEFTVFTRNGSRVYHSLSPRIFWDGKSIGGEELSEGIYYYVIEEEGDSERFEEAGFIHLFR
ncbi:MAG: gliding motility-associated C-terminal domain-containing protein [Bacteroidota bacterium]